MKITKETSGLIVLKEKNIFAFSFGVIFALVWLMLIINPDMSVEPVPVWASLAGVSIGIIVILITKITVVTIDKTIEKLSIKNKNILGKTLKEYSFNLIKQLELEKTISRQPGSRNRGATRITLYGLVLILNDGSRVELGTSSGGRFLGMQNNSKKAVGLKIATFLNIPFKEKDSAFS